MRREIVVKLNPSTTVEVKDVSRDYQNDVKGGKQIAMILGKVIKDSANLLVGKTVKQVTNARRLAPGGTAVSEAETVATEILFYRNVNVNNQPMGGVRFSLVAPIGNDAPYVGFGMASSWTADLQKFPYGIASANTSQNGVEVTIVWNQ